jgi:hypothetical protein
MMFDLLGAFDDDSLLRDRTAARRGSFLPHEGRLQVTSEASAGSPSPHCNLTLRVIGETLVKRPPRPYPP